MYQLAKRPIDTFSYTNGISIAGMVCKKWHALLQFLTSQIVLTFDGIMKKLLIIRHAKSSWVNLGQDDFDRPLNERGHRDAPMMAKRLKEAGVEIDAFISSTANRALTTATYFGKEYGVSTKDIHKYKKLYHALPSVFAEVVSEIDDDIQTAAIFSHNPGITTYANQLSATQIDDMPTCAVFAVQANISHWNDFANAEKEFWFFDYPRS